jgi:hypothetical protein
VKKLKEHVYQKILKLDTPSQMETNSNNPSNGANSIPNENSSNSVSESGPSSATTGNVNGNQLNNSVTDTSAIASRSIELICSEQVLLDPEMSLRTIKNMIWKGSGDLIIHYKVKT